MACRLPIGLQGIPYVITGYIDEGRSEGIGLESDYKLYGKGEDYDIKGREKGTVPFFVPFFRPWSAAGIPALRARTFA